MNRIHVRQDDKAGRWRGLATMGACCLFVWLTGCATIDPEPAESALSRSGWATAASPSNAPVTWVHQTFPGKRSSSYRYERKDGRDTLHVNAASSASMLRQTVRVEPNQLGQLRFSWMVPSLIEAADLSQRDGDDSPVRVVLAFEGDRTRFSAKDAALSELSELLTGEPLPFATLMYVWSNHRPAGTVVVNPRTGRIRKLVMESGPGRLSQWLDYERDVRADFVKVFGEAPGALLAIGIMTDTDNTQSQAQAWYGPVRHVLMTEGKPLSAKLD
jgi:hypothetical protein